MNPIKQTADAAHVLSDWLGEGGKPVPSDIADMRAKHCLKCPKHAGGLWWEIAKDPIATAIKKALELKHNMKITVPQENDLEMCLVCGCAMRLKVHVPAKHFRETITPEQMEEFITLHCWIPSEINKS